MSWEQIVGNQLLRVVFCAVFGVVISSAQAQDCTSPCDSALKGSCFDDSHRCCCGANGNADCGNRRHGDCGCCRCRKTLLHWPGQEVSYASPEDEEEPIATDRPDFTETSSVVGLG